MGAQFSIDDHHQDVLNQIIEKNITNNDLNEKCINNKKLSILKSNSDLSKITTETVSTNNENSNDDKTRSFGSLADEYITSEDEKHNSIANADWDFFEEIDIPDEKKYFSDEELYCERKIHKALSLTSPINEPPIYIIESSISTQKLWYMTAGKRPRQPEEERKEIEKLWMENFKASNVSYEKVRDNKKIPTLVKSVSASQYANLQLLSQRFPVTIKDGNNFDTVDQNEEVDEIARQEFNADIVLRGLQPFSNSVSKSFSVNIGPSTQSVSSITLQIPRFRVIQNRIDDNTYAEYLVVITLGGYNKVKFGIWRRFSDFNNLAKKIEKSFKDNICNYSNSLLSWKCIIQRKRWYRCLDSEYLAFKCFLLERFLHDVLFESSTSTIISEFLAID